jgi:DNA mismatch repair protein MutL
MIKRLESTVASRIAAGEVIERPASIAKELIENSIDAGAKNITLQLEQGGKISFVIEDDGSGITFEELPLALERYATSKISSLEDLEKIATLGYRGEALASVAAVSRMEIRSRAEGEQSGGIIRSEGGKVTLHTESPCDKGTRIQVDDLFFNLPARRKFLKNGSAELRRVLQVVNDYALIYPFLTFRVFNGGKKVLELFAADSTDIRLNEKWGTEVKRFFARTASGSCSVNLWWNPAPDTRRIITTIFVNGRRVQDATVRAAICSGEASANGEWLAALAMPPEDLDVNIHPTKEEIRFRRSQDVFKAVHDAARKIYAQYRGGAVSYSDEASVPPAFTAASDKVAFDISSKVFSPDPWRPVKDRGEDRVAEPSAPDTVFIPAEKPPYTTDARSADHDLHGRSASSKQIESKETERDATFPDVRYIGQTARGFLLFDFPGRLAIVDPHAAHERILYEEIARSFQGSMTVQKLAIPPEIPTALLAEVETAATELKGLCFTVDDGKLTGVPSLVGRGRLSPLEMLRSALRGLEVESDPRKRDREVWWRWARLACRDAVKLTTQIERQEAEHLFAELQRCDSPWICPHGRPVVFFLDNKKLEAWFER